MKLRVLILGVSLLLVVESSYLAKASVDENLHELDMTVLCENLELTGYFDLKFDGSRSFPIWGSKAPIPINFRRLHVKTESISIGNKTFNDVGEDIIIEAQPATKSYPTAQLYICREPSGYVQDIYISRIQAVTGDARMEFSVISGENFVSFGKGSLMHLRNKYSSSNEWILKIEGRFQVKGNRDLEVMYDKTLKFSGLLEIESPELPNSQKIRLGLNFSYKKDEFRLEGGNASLVSGYNSSMNKFFVESMGIVNEDEVLEDGYRIDMTKEIYLDDRFLKEFHVENVKEIILYDVKTAGNRLSVKFHMEYVGESLFPKIGVTTRYFLMTGEGPEENPIVEISNLETDEKEIVKFLDNRDYTIEIFVEKFVKDNIIVNFTHMNFQKIINENDISLEFPYRYLLQCETPSFEKQDFECFTQGSFRKRDDEDSEVLFRTKGFYARIQSSIGFEIEDIDRILEEIEEDEELSFSKRITLISETSNSIEIMVFMEVEDGFGIKSFWYHPKRFSRKGDFVDIKVHLRAPSIVGEARSCEIKIFIFYRMNESNDFILYLPDPNIEATIVEDLVIKGTFRGSLEEGFPYIVAFIISTCFVALEHLIVSKSHFEPWIRDYLKEKFEITETKREAVIYLIGWLLIIGIFIFSFYLSLSFLYGSRILIIILASIAGVYFLIALVRHRKELDASAIKSKTEEKIEEEIKKSKKERKTR
jgi:hypothetical protein